MLIYFVVFLLLVIILILFCKKDSTGDLFYLKYHESIRLDLKFNVNFCFWYVELFEVTSNNREVLVDRFYVSNLRLSTWNTIYISPGKTGTYRLVINSDAQPEARYFIVSGIKRSNYLKLYELNEKVVLGDKERMIIFNTKDWTKLDECFNDFSVIDGPGTFEIKGLTTGIKMKLFDKT